MSPAPKSAPAAPAAAAAYSMPAAIAALIAERDAKASEYATVAERNPEKSEGSLRALRADVTRIVGKMDARIAEMLLEDGGPDALVNAGYAPWKTPAANPVTVTPATISDDDLLAGLAEWKSKIAALPANGYESVRHNWDKNHVQPLLKVARSRPDTFKVEGSTVTRIESDAAAA